MAKVKTLTPVQIVSQMKALLKPTVNKLKDADGLIRPDTIEKRLGQLSTKERMAADNLMKAVNATPEGLPAESVFEAAVRDFELRLRNLNEPVVDPKAAMQLHDPVRADALFLLGDKAKPPTFVLRALDEGEIRKDITRYPSMVRVGRGRLVSPQAAVKAFPGMCETLWHQSPAVSAEATLTFSKFKPVSAATATKVFANMRASSDVIPYLERFMDGSKDARLYMAKAASTDGAEMVFMVAVRGDEVRIAYDYAPAAEKKPYLPPEYLRVPR
jgi:hypothetical protein